VRVNNEVKLDALVWLEFLENFNGDCYMQDMHWDTNEALEPFTDSTGNSSLGCGAYNKGKQSDHKIF
jgi:hypothetical protein